MRQWLSSLVGITSSHPLECPRFREKSQSDLAGLSAFREPFDQFLRLSLANGQKGGWEWFYLRGKKRFDYGHPNLFF